VVFFIFSFNEPQLKKIFFPQPIKKSPISNSPNYNGAMVSLCPYTNYNAGALNSTLQACIGKQSCSFTASNTVLGQDPCEDVVKDLVIVYGCFGTNEKRVATFS